MRIQLFNPPVHHYMGLHYRMNPPLGLPILAAVLNKAGHTCEVTDLEALTVSPERLRTSFEKQPESWPDVVGFTALSSQVRGARESIAALRTAGFTGRILVGGPHVTSGLEAANEVLEWGADLAVMGEADTIIRQCVEENMSGVTEGPMTPVEMIPVPDWSVHNPAPGTYHGNAPTLDQPESITMWSRGCPHACIFCGNPVFGHTRKRFRPVANVVAELADLKRRRIKSLFVYDDELIGTAHPLGWWEELTDQISPFGFVWKTQGRCSEKFITKDIMERAYASGCRAIMWGVESFSQKVLSAAHKGTRLQDIWHTLRTAKEAGIKNWVFTMVGQYQETDEDAALTCEALRQAYQEGLIDYRQTTVCTVVPGTELYRKAVAEGWYTPSPEAGPQMAQIYASTPWLSTERIAYWLAKYAEACPVNHAGRMAA